VIFAVVAAGTAIAIEFGGAGDRSREGAEPVTGSVLMFLAVFYAGALFASARSWLAVWRGAPGYSALRDVTGIGDRAALRRLFGLTRRDGRYQVTLAAVLKHRRPAGILLTDLPVHLLLLIALVWAAANASAPAAMAVGWAAAANALILAVAAVSVLAGRTRAFAK